jgi:hypothetical protein
MAYLPEEKHKLYIFDKEVVKRICATYRKSGPTVTWETNA